MTTPPHLALSETGYKNLDQKTSLQGAKKPALREGPAESFETN